MNQRQIHLFYYLKRPVLSILCAVWLVVSSFSTAYGDAFGVEALILTSHLSGETIQLGKEYRRKLSDDGRFIVTPGLEIYYDKDMRPGFLKADTLRFTFGAYYDSMDHKAGYVAIKPHWNFPLHDRMGISLGLGPALIFRETWNAIPGYRDDGYFNESERFLSGYQYKVIIGGEIDLRYKLTPRLQAVWSIIPGIPYVITQSIGILWSF